MDYFTIVLAVLFITFLLQSLKSTAARATKRLPPGPTPLPIIGNLHLLLGGQPHKSLAELASKYGHIMCLKFGLKTTFVVSSPILAKEVLQKQDLSFCNIALPDASKSIDHHQYSVMFLPIGPKWRILRKILNSFILSNQKLDANQPLRLRKVEDLIAYSQKNSQTGEPVEIGRAAFVTTLNLLSNTIFSEDVTDHDSDSNKEFKFLIRSIMEELGNPNFVDCYPFLAKIDPQGIRRRVNIHMNKLLKLFDGIVNERLEQRKLQGIVKNDLLDLLLSRSEENPEEISRKDIKHLFMDLFIAGTDTSSATVEWAMAETIRNPEIMMKAKEELSRVIGKGKSIEEADIARLPYLRCIIKETLRLHPPGPLFLPRNVEHNTEVDGYTLTKGSQVLINAWAIGRDPSVWEIPLIFKPERFLELDIDVRGQDFELIPFGAGRRVCPGLLLGMRMIHLMVGSMLNSFDWKLEGHVKPEELDMKESSGLSLQMAHPLRAIPVPM